MFDQVMARIAGNSRPRHVRRTTGRKSTKNAVSLVTVTVTVTGEATAAISAQALAGVRPSASCTWPW